MRLFVGERGCFAASNAPSKKNTTSSLEYCRKVPYGQPCTPSQLLPPNQMNEHQHLLFASIPHSLSPPSPCLSSQQNPLENSPLTYRRVETIHSHFPLHKAITKKGIKKIWTGIASLNRPSSVYRQKQKQKCVNSQIISRINANKKIENSN